MAFTALAATPPFVAALAPMPNADLTPLNIPFNAQPRAGNNKQTASIIISPHDH